MSILQNAAFVKEGAQSKDPQTWADLPLKEQEFWAKVFAGEKQPPLYTDTIAKNVFSADVHPDRLNFLLRGIAKDCQHRGVSHDTKQGGAGDDTPGKA